MMIVRKSEAGVLAERLTSSRARILREALDSDVNEDVPELYDDEDVEYLIRHRLIRRSGKQFHITQDGREVLQLRNDI
jgi:hypothetical protein